MEASVRWGLVAAAAPIAWGGTYYVTRQTMPPDLPLWGAAVRALPAGLLLLAVRRERPRGVWWWRSFVLGTLNMGAFFALVYVAAQLLRTSVAATVMAVLPVVMMLLAWPLLGERPRFPPLLGGGFGVVGVVLLVSTGVDPVDPLGLAASVAAMLMSALGHILTKRWGSGHSVLSVTSWQLVAGGLVLLVAAFAVEGPPPAPTGKELLGIGYVSILATAFAYAAWFTALRHLEAGTVGLIGLLNPVTGVLLGTALAGELLTSRQIVGLVLVLGGVLLGQPVFARRRKSTVDC